MSLRSGTHWGLSSQPCPVDFRPQLDADEPTDPKSFAAQASPPSPQSAGEWLSAIEHIQSANRMLGGMQGAEGAAPAAGNKSSSTWQNAASSLCDRYLPESSPQGICHHRFDRKILKPPTDVHDRSSHIERFGLPPIFTSACMASYTSPVIHDGWSAGSSVSFAA